MLVKAKVQTEAEVTLIVTYKLVGYDVFDNLITSKLFAKSPTVSEIADFLMKSGSCKAKVEEWYEEHLPFEDFEESEDE